MEPTLNPVGSGTTEPSLTSNKNGAIKKIYYILAIILSATISGGAVWYFMNQQNSNSIAKLNTQISAKEKSIADLTARIAILTPATSTTTGTTTTSAAATDDLTTLRTFCTTDTTKTLSSIIYESNNDGIFGSCELADSFDGKTEIVVKENGLWTLVPTGNGGASDTQITKYKLPLSVSRAYIARSDLSR